LPRPVVTMPGVATLVAGLACLPGVAGHSRFFCPAARNPSTGLKTGPCGVAGDDGAAYYAATEAITIAPGPLTIVWQESIAHTGAPWRFSLSGDGNDLEECTLLDHVPHSPYSTPTFADESTWPLYNLTIVIPDVSCEKCSLHLVNPMTDKIGDAKSVRGWAGFVGSRHLRGTKDALPVCRPPGAAACLHMCECEHCTFAGG
jgi:hypothetical protein